MKTQARKEAQGLTTSPLLVLGDWCLTRKFVLENFGLMALCTGAV